MEWKPTCVVHLTRPEGGDLAATRTCFNLKDTLKTTFFVGSGDGELVYADWIKPEVMLPSFAFYCVKSAPHQPKGRILPSWPVCWHCVTLLAWCDSPIAKSFQVKVLPYTQRVVLYMHHQKAIGQDKLAISHPNIM